MTVLRSNRAQSFHFGDFGITRTTGRRRCRTLRQLRLESLEQRWLLTCTGAATEVVCESFEAAGPTYDTGLVSFPDANVPFHNGTSDYFIRTDGLNISDPAPAAYTGEDGSFFWATEDTDDPFQATGGDLPGGNGLDFQTLEISGINIAGHTGLTVSGLFAAGDSFSDAPPVDEMRVEYSINSAPFAVGLCFNHANSSGPLRQDFDCNGATSPPAGPVLTNVFSTHTFSIPDGSTLDLRVTIKADSGGEDVAFDEIKVIGLPLASNSPPAAALTSAPNVGEPEIGQTSYSFDVTYSDDSAIDISTIGSSDVSISGPGSMTITGATPDIGTDGTPRTVTYTATPPGGSWDSGDNGAYTILVNGSQVGDDGAPQLFVSGAALGTFTVNATNTDPTVTGFLAEDVIFTDFGETSYTFTIEYSDVGGIDVSSFDASDVIVRDPSSTPLTVVSGVETPPTGTDGSPRTATYTVTPPSGSWDTSDVGTPYTIELVGGQVFDINGASVAANPSLTTFSVIDTKLLNESFETDGLGTRYAGSTPAPATFNDGSSDYWARVRNGATPPDTPSGLPAFVNPDIAWFWAAEDTDSPDGNTNDFQTIEFPATGSLNTTGWTGLSFEGLFAATANFSDTPADDGVIVDISQDGGSTYSSLFCFSQTLSSGGPLGLDSDCDLTVDGTSLGTTFQSFSSPIPNGSLLKLRISVKADTGGEEVAFDNLMISGTPPAANQRPTALLSSAPDVGEPEIGQTSYSFDVTYSDDSSIDAGTLDTSDVTVTPQGGGPALTVTGAAFLPGNTPSKVVSYTVTPPGGSWDASDNDTYDIDVNASQVGDDDGTQLFVAAGNLGSFNVNATNTPPLVTDFLAQDVIFSDFGETSYTFTIEYSDVGGIDVSSIDTSDVIVRDPSNTPLTVVSGVETPLTGTDGSPRTAAYTITPPSGSWDSGDAGTYTIELVGGQVLDISGASVAGANPLTTFDVIPTKVLNESFELPGPSYDSGLVSFPGANVPFNNGPNDYFNRTDGSDISDPAPAAYTGADGDFFWAAEDTDDPFQTTGGTLPGGNGLDDQVMLISGINIASHTGLTFSGRFAAGSSFSDAPPRDKIFVEYDVDNTGFVNGLCWAPSGNPGSMNLDGDCNPDNGATTGTALTNTFATHTFSIPNGSTLDLRITVRADSSSEDVAFDNLMVTGTPTAPTEDFGDAPDPTYPTLLASNGARHITGGPAFLGVAVDAEADGQPNATAAGDDIAGATPDDEDGVVFPSLPLTAGTIEPVNVTATASGLLNAWVDFNDNGSWADPGEQIFTDVALVAGLNVLSFSVPASATATAQTFARFRFDTGGGLSFDGPAPNGEVEDYEVPIQREVDLQVSKVDTPDPVTAGSGPSNLTHTATVTNAGPSDASGVTLSEVVSLPPGTTIVSITPSGTTTYAPSNAAVGTWTVGNLAVGASETLTIVMTVGASTADGATVSDTATVTGANETLINPGDDTATETTTVQSSGLQDVTALVQVDFGRSVFNRRTGQEQIDVVVTNTSAGAIGAPLWFVITSISDPGVTLANPSGTTPGGDPFVDLSGLIGADLLLSPGEATTPATLVFNNPARRRFTFQSQVHAGSVSPLLVFGGPTNGQVGAETLTPQLLQPVVAEAIARWTASGVDAEALTALSAADTIITELPDSSLGLASSTAIWIDQDAAGYGWSVNGSGVGVDLLSVVAHEMGHLLGLDHDAMGLDDTVETGVRRLPRMLAKAGDANQDGTFDRLDIAQVLQRGKYVTGQPATWADGDFNGDGRVDQRDIVAALQTGAYGQRGDGDQVTAELDAVFAQIGLGAASLD